MLLNSQITLLMFTTSYTSTVKDEKVAYFLSNNHLLISNDL